MSLLKETISILEDNGKSPDDVLWCGSKTFGWFPFEAFANVAHKGYDAGFGAPKVAQDLLIVGKDFWLERHEYDGSEWWEYKTIPTRPANLVFPKHVVIDSDSDEIGWVSLNDLNR